MRIEQATAFLYALKPEGIRFGLENTRLVLGNLGNPHQGFQAVHLAGSNGKGSTAAFLEAILRGAGKPVGLYTSPHLNHFRERFRIGGEAVSDEAIEAAMDRFLRDGLEVDPREVQAWVDREDMVRRMEAGSWYQQRGGASQFCRLTFFECTTVLAMMIFAEQGVEVAVMECGMGGRLDATNVLTPLVSVITPIHLEHTQWLGDTLQAIAGEKAGIIKHGVPVVSALQAESAMRVLAGVAEERVAPLHVRGRDFDGDGNFWRARFWAEDCRVGPVCLGLAGRHQVDNAALAVGCVPSLRRAGLRIPATAVQAGLEEVSWPARFECLEAPGDDSGRVVLDGAHNPDGARALAATVREVLGDQAVRLVFGVLGDKDADAMLSVLVPLVSQVALVRPQDARGRDPASLLERVAKPAVVCASVGEALSSFTSSPSPPTLVTGSLTVVGEARAWLLERGYSPKGCALVADNELI